MTIILLALTAAAVAGIVWLVHHGLAWWWIALGVVLVLIFIVFSFLAYRKVAMERDKVIGEKETLAAQIEALKDGVQWKQKYEDLQKQLDQKPPQTTALSNPTEPALASFSPFSRVHKCSKCNRGIEISPLANMLGGTVTCPECGNVDDA